MNQLTINQVAKLCGITVRTLHYYDGIGLLSPSSVAENGYRMYDDNSLAKLQEILFFKELDIPLKEIKHILNSPSYNKKDALSRQKQLLVLKRDRLNKIIKLLDDNLENDKLNLKEFDMTEIKKHIEKYKEETKQRWGNTDAYKQSSKKNIKIYRCRIGERITNEANQIFESFANCMNKAENCKDADSLVKEWQSHITRYYYDCTDEILLDLADMYIYDERFKANIDKHGDGLAEFISSSIKNCLNS